MLPVNAGWEAQRAAGVRGLPDGSAGATAPARMASSNSRRRRRPSWVDRRWAAHWTAAPASAPRGSIW